MAERNKKRFFNRFVTLCLSLMMAAAGIISFAAVPVEAKSAPKLSAKTVTIAKGGKQTIRLKNGKGNWTIKANGVAKIKSKTKTSATITPLKAGNTIVTCKVGGKKLSCKVKVLNNSIGKPKTDVGYACVVGGSKVITPNKNVKLLGTTYDSKKGSVTVKTETNERTGESFDRIYVKALDAGRFTLRIDYEMDGVTDSGDITFVFIDGFRGKTKVKKNNENYRKWRKKTIDACVTPDMSTWEIIDAIGTLISSGKYGNKGGATGIQLWYGGNGTCWSGAMMMDDFMKDLGISSKIHFMGNKGGSVDIFGMSLMYASQHKDTWVTLGGEKYELNAQPGFSWPMGIVKR